MAYLDRDGVRIYYDVQGNGPAVLLSHGYSATAQMWTKQVEALKDRYPRTAARRHQDQTAGCLAKAG